MDDLRALDLHGRCVGLQLYGEDPSIELCEFLRAAGAEVVRVAPYVYAPASDGAKVIELIGEMAAGRVDAIAFTSAGQIDRLFAVSAEQGVDAALERAWPQMRVAAIGPI